MLRVVKVGGSLLNLSDLPQRLRDWADLQPPGLNFWVVGGGGVVEAMRELDSVHQFSPAQIHWWCVRLLSTTAEILSSLVPDWRLLSTEAEVRSVIEMHTHATQQTGNFVLDVGKLYTARSEQFCDEQRPSRPERASALSLPQDWSTTTDSIAVWLSCRFAAEELVLLKSVDVEGGDWRQHAEDGLVDAAFPGFASLVPSVRAVNLRGSWDAR